MSQRATAGHHAHTASVLVEKKYVKEGFNREAASVAVGSVKSEIISKVHEKKKEEVKKEDLEKKEGPKVMGPPPPEGCAGPTRP